MTEGPHPVERKARQPARTTEIGKIPPHRTDPPWAKRERNGFNEFREANRMPKKATHAVKIKIEDQV